MPPWHYISGTAITQDVSIKEAVSHDSVVLLGDYITLTEKFSHATDDAMTVCKTPARVDDDYRGIIAASVQMKSTGFESCLHLALTQSTKLQQELTTTEESLLLLFRFRVTLSFGVDTSQKLPTRADDIYIMDHRCFCSYGVDTGIESCFHLVLTLRVQNSSKN